MDIAKVETRHLAQLVKTIDDKGVHDVAGRVRQHLTKIMRHAVQQGTIKYNPAYDLDGLIRQKMRILNASVYSGWYVNITFWRILRLLIGHG